MDVCGCVCICKTEHATVGLLGLFPLHTCLPIFSRLRALPTNRAPFVTRIFLCLIFNELTSICLRGTEISQFWVCFWFGDAVVEISFHMRATNVYVQEEVDVPASLREMG